MHKAAIWTKVQSLILFLSQKELPVSNITVLIIVLQLQSIFYEINYKSETIKKGGKVLRCNVCQVQNIKKMEYVN